MVRWSRFFLLSSITTLLVGGCRSFERTAGIHDPRLEQSRIVVVYCAGGSRFVFEKVTLEGNQMKAVGLKLNQDKHSWERFDGIVAADSVEEVFVAGTDMRRTFLGTLMILGYLAVAVGLYRYWPGRWERT